MTETRKTDPRTKCKISKLAYNFTARIGFIYLPDQNVCDMRGCIKIFTEIDEEVETIFAVSESIPGIMYSRKDSSWRAYDLKNKKGHDYNVFDIEDYKDK